MYTTTLATLLLLEYFRELVLGTTDNNVLPVCCLRVEGEVGAGAVLAVQEFRLGRDPGVLESPGHY